MRRHGLGWATFDTAVRGLGVGDSVTTVVDQGTPAQVLAKYAVDADADVIVLVLGERRRRWMGPDTQRDIQSLSDRPVLRINDLIDDQIVADLTSDRLELARS